MKKILTLLLTLLMVFTLVGCNSKEDTPVVQEPEQQEVVEPAKEEPEVVGGYVDVEDKTLTDELKDIFNKAYEGYTGMLLEPVELYQTQVVAGTNYKFVCSGTKTTNPPITGTYFVTVYKDLEGNCSIIDVETVTESTGNVDGDPSQYSYWVVVYDQLGNELSRTTAKYGTTVKDPSGKDVVVKGNTYFNTVINYSSSKKDNDNPTPGSTPGSTCSYEKTELYYTYAKADGYLFTIRYLYNNGKYDLAEYNDTFSISSGFDSIQVGDWFHYHRGEEIFYGKCEKNGEGAVLPEFKTISFDSNGVTTTSFPSSRKTVYNKTTLAPHDVPTATDYVFEGWYREPECQNEWDFYRDIVTTDTTLYAKWSTQSPTPTACLVMFLSNGNGKVVNISDEEVDSINVARGTTYEITDNSISIGGVSYYAIPDDGWHFEDFDIISGAITEDTYITVYFEQE